VIDVIKVLLADDHAVVLKGLRFFLSTQKDIEIVGEAKSGKEAFRLARALRPDVILMDVRMPDLGGAEATEWIKRELPDSKILMLTSFVDQETVVTALKSGASGYLLKDVEPDELAAAIRAAYRGEQPLHPEATNQLLNHLKAGGASEKDGFDTLTPREKEVLREIVRGRGNKEIADALFITEKTVKTHVSNILSKLGLHDRTQAAILAVKNGWFEE